MIITDKAQIKIAELRESNNLRLLGSDELECYELIESDLKLPADTTFTRSSVTYLSDGTQIDANQPRFEQGKFGKAIMLEEGTTNYFGSYANTFDSEQVVFYPDGLASGKTWNDCWDSNEKAYHGGLGITMYHLYMQNYKLDIGSALSQDTKFTFTWEHKGYLWSVIVHYSTDGTTWTGWNKDTIYTATQYYNCELGYWEGTQQLHLKVDGQKLTSSNPIDYWKRIGFTFKVPAGTRYIRITFDWYNASGTYPAGGWVRNFQLEQKPYATSFVDGTRASEKLTLPIEVLNHNAFTFEMWIKQSIVTTSAFIGGNQFLNLGQGLWLWNFSPAWSDPESLNRRIIAEFGSDVSGTRQYYDLISQTPFSTVNFEHFAITFDGATFRFYRNGVLWGSKKPSKINPFTQIILDSAGWIIDDLRISNKARSDEEILTAYQSGQPLLVDEWTTYKLDFDDKIRITAQGQIICNEFIEI